MSSPGALPKTNHNGRKCEGCGNVLGQKRVKVGNRKGRIVVKGRHTTMLVNGRYQAPLLCPQCRKLAQFKE